MIKGCFRFFKTLVGTGSVVFIIISTIKPSRQIARTKYKQQRPTVHNFLVMAVLDKIDYFWHHLGFPVGRVAVKETTASQYQGKVHFTLVRTLQVAVQGIVVAPA